MSDSSAAHSQIHLEAIRQAISEGRYSAQQIHNILLKEISKELNKPTKEVDMEYVNACQALLDELNQTRAAQAPSHYAQNLNALQKKNHHRFNLCPQSGLARFAAVMCLTIFLLCLGLLIPDGWILSRQTEDVGQYIMQGIETPAGFGSVADAGPALDHTGVFDTTSWQEVVYLMGGKPQVPRWLPSGWYILSYTVSLTDVTSSLTIIYRHEETESSLIFQSTTFFELSSLYNHVEQNNVGSLTKLINGTKVYITENIDNTTATWNSTDSSCLLSGNVSQKELVRIVDSME